jgi:hypothetical protein
MYRVVLVCLSCGFVFGQAPRSKPSFEVVSIKRTSATLMALIAAGKVPVRMDDAQVALGSVDLAMLIQMAYRLSCRPDLGPWMVDGRVVRHLGETTSRRFEEPGA